MSDRWYAEILREKLTRPYVHLVFGARQTGKSTLLQALLPSETMKVDLADPKERSRHLANPRQNHRAAVILPMTTLDAIIQSRSRAGGLSCGWLGSRVAAAH